jgi:hypothetical protein
MPSKDDEAHAKRRYLGEGKDSRSAPPDNKPTARAQYLCERLHAAGPRPTYEAMKEVAAGEDLDEVLERYGRIPSSFYRILGASSFFKPMIVWASTCLSRKK